MKSKYMTGIIAGGLLGATASVYAMYKSSPRQRKRLMRRGTKMVKNASKLMNSISSLDMLN